jgi:hypothetical protein
MAPIHSTDGDEIVAVIGQATARRFFAVYDLTPPPQGRDSVA